MNQIVKKRRKKKNSYYFILLFIVTLHFSCVDKKQQGLSNTTVTTTSSNSNKDNQVDVDGIRLGYENLTYQGKLSKVVKRNNDLDECIDWKIEPKYFDNLLENMRLVEGVEWGALCYNYPCFYTGIVTDGKNSLDIKINAASFVTLQNEDGVMYFISEKQQTYFLAACDCCGEE